VTGRLLFIAARKIASRLPLLRARPARERKRAAGGSSAGAGSSGALRRCGAAAFAGALSFDAARNRHFWLKERMGVAHGGDIYFAAVTAARREIDLPALYCSASLALTRNILWRGGCGLRALNATYCSRHRDNMRKRRTRLPY